jgi:hypothetical protein
VYVEPVQNVAGVTIARSVERGSRDAFDHGLVYDADGVVVGKVTCGGPDSGTVVSFVSAAARPARAKRSGRPVR